jgi:tetratricopeptide (TPR) repeat protein
MKFTNGLLVLTCVWLFSGCSSFFAKQESTPAVKNDTAEQQTLSPIQKQAQALKSQTNSYKEQASQLDATISSDIRDQFEQALRLKQQGKLSDGKKGLLQLAKRSPNLSGVWLQLALINKQLSEELPSNNQALVTETLGYLNKAVTANQHNYYAHNELAQLLRQQGQFQQALRHYELAIKSWPAFAEAYLNRGILYDLYLGEKQLALQDYQLYQALSEQDSRQVKGWIMDLQRQISQSQTNSQNKKAQ